jgi:transposase InsO family protein
VKKGCSVTLACKAMKRTRQSYYKALGSKEKQHYDSSKIMQMVQPIRKLMPRLGGRKLRHMMVEQLQDQEVKIGRDKFFHWLKQNDLLISPKKRYVHTTQSHHRFWVYDNLTEDLELTRPNQLWVSDITYIRTMEGFCYLALITDAYSRKIVGFDISDSLELEGCLRALKSTFQTASNLGQLIHHSDRGIQYCSNQYVELLKQKGISVSMAAKGNCYENALAERVNGILKDEFNLDIKFKTKEHAIQAVKQSIYIYNNYRPHWSLKLKTPNECHQVINHC